MLDSILESKINDLTEQYVCSVGKCETVAGEILRAYNRVVYRYFNDGDVIKAQITSKIIEEG